MSDRIDWWPAQPDELLALKDEIASLSRVRMPLVEGLREVAQDHPERLSRIALWVADKLEEGISLDDAIAALAPSLRNEGRASS